MTQIIGLRHICIHTDQMEKTLSFYTDVLGFEHFRSTIVKEGYIKGMQFNFVRAGTCIIMLTQPADLSWVKELGNTNGNHIMLEIVGLDEMMEKVIKAGFEFEKTEPEVNDKGNKTIFFKGPCGERIGFTELGKDQESYVIS